MAPELFLTNSAIDFTKNEGIDVFALGATLYFMLTGKPPWMAKNQLDLATKIKNFELTFPPKMIDPHVKVRLRCLHCFCVTVLAAYRLVLLNGVLGEFCTDGLLFS